MNRAQLKRLRDRGLGDQKTLSGGKTKQGYSTEPVSAFHGITSCVLAMAPLALHYLSLFHKNPNKRDFNRERPVPLEL
jgi:hypothetical protein